MTYLLLAAVAPAYILLRYIYKKDKSKEPAGMLIFLVILGVLSCFPASFAEIVVDFPISAVFEKGTVSYNFVSAFFGVAIIEEGCKFIVMYLYTHKHKEFNGLFDGMVYAVFVSLGFAAFENIMYVVQGGFGTALMRALLSVPGHMFFSVFMGYYYSLWHVNKLCDASEKYFAVRGFIVIREPAYKYSHYLLLAVIVPTLVHGFFDFCLFDESPLLIIVFVLFVAVLYIFCFLRIRRMSNADLEDYKLIPLMLCKKYPELIGVISPYSAAPIISSAEPSDPVKLAEMHNQLNQQYENRY